MTKKADPKSTATNGETRVLDVEQYRVRPRGVFTLGVHDPDDDGGLSKPEGRALLKQLKKRLNLLQQLLYATERYAVLVVLQGMDTGGKDGAIKNVVSAFNPQGFQVTSFKVPTPEELGHDFLWRVHKNTPRRGMIGVFNRSHYEDVLVVRVENLVPESAWRLRYDAIREFEEMLCENDVAIVKFFLHISKDEQRLRLEDRLKDPTEHWKFRKGDLRARAKWDAYMAAYEAAIEKCTTERAPWYVVPANRKWYRNLVVAQVLVDTLERLGLNWPVLDEDAQNITID